MNRLEMRVRFYRNRMGRYSNLSVRKVRTTYEGAYFYLMGEIVILMKMLETKDRLLLGGKKKYL